MKKINLSDLPKKRPFQAPEGYLEKLPLLVQQRLQEETSPQPSRFGSWLLRPQLHLGLAAVLLLLVGGLFFYQPAEAPQPDAQALLEQVSEQELVNYLQSSTSLSMQEINSGVNWQEEASFLQGLPEDEALEDEVIINLDTYTADEIWK